MATIRKESKIYPYSFGIVMVVAMAAVFHGFGRSFERSEGNRKRERKTVIEELNV